MPPNPFSGPNYIVALRNAVERHIRPNEYMEAPKTGGTQISLRLPENVLNHIEILVEKSEWNRAEILQTLIERGLFDLYSGLNGSTVEEIIESVVAKSIPPMAPAKNVYYQDMFEYKGYYAVSAVKETPNTWEITFKAGIYENDELVDKVPLLRRTIPKLGQGLLNHLMDMSNIMEARIDQIGVLRELKSKQELEAIIRSKLQSPKFAGLKFEIQEIDENERGENFKILPLEPLTIGKIAAEEAGEIFREARSIYSLRS